MSGDSFMESVVSAKKLNPEDLSINQKQKVYKKWAIETFITFLINLWPLFSYTFFN